MLITIILSMLAMALGSAPDESFNCKGNLLVEKPYMEKSIKINDGTKSFSFERKDAPFITVFVPEEKNAVLKVFPWDGIHYKKLELSRNISVEISGEKSFQIHLVDLEEKYHLNCRMND